MINKNTNSINTTSITHTRSEKEPCIRCNCETNQFEILDLHKVITKDIVYKTPSTTTYHIQYESRSINVPTCEECSQFLQKEDNEYGIIVVSGIIGFLFFIPSMYSLNQFYSATNANNALFIGFIIFAILTLIAIAVLISRVFIINNNRKLYAERRNRKIVFAKLADYREVRKLYDEGWRFGKIESNQ